MKINLASRSEAAPLGAACRALLRGLLSYVLMVYPYALISHHNVQVHIGLLFLIVYLYAMNKSSS
jgi:hypothetical protein